MHITTAPNSLAHITVSWTICLLHIQTASASETTKFPMYNCGSAKMSQPLVQQYSLNVPDHCSNSSTVYHPHKLRQSIPVLQIPSFTPLLVHNCLIEVKVKVGYCGNSGSSHNGTCDENPSGENCLSLLTRVHARRIQRGNAVQHPSVWVSQGFEIVNTTYAGSG